MKVPPITHLLVGVVANGMSLPAPHHIPTNSNPIATFTTGPNGTITAAVATGALSWTLSAGEVPGPLPVPVTLRFRASMVAEENSPGSRLEAKSQVWRTRGIGASLCFGHLAPDGEEEGRQHLENGDSFRDRDWSTQIKDKILPAAYGLKAPGGVYLAVPSRTYGIYDANLEDLGNWARKVSERSALTRFRILMDQTRARIFGFQEDLGVHVPILWVDRFGHWVGFRWRKEAESGQVSVQVMNNEGKGIHVRWAPATGGSALATILRAEFIGIPAPSLLVRGYQDPPETFPAAMPAPATRSKESWFSCRPTQVLLGGPSALASPDLVPGSVQDPEAPPATNREWTFAYDPESRSELRTLTDPWGVTTHFTFETYRFTHQGKVFRGVSAIERTDSLTGTTHSQSWERHVPSVPGGIWKVTHLEDYSDGIDTEARTQVHDFLEVGPDPTRAFLKSSRILGQTGTSQTITHEPGILSLDGMPLPTHTHVTGSGMPATELLQKYDYATRKVKEESLKVADEWVQKRTFTYHESFHGLDTGKPREVTLQRGHLPPVRETMDASRDERQFRHTLSSGGQERCVHWTCDIQGRPQSLSMVASWAKDGGPVYTWKHHLDGRTSRAISGPGLDHPLIETWKTGINGRPEQISDFQGLTTNFTFDVWGRPIAMEGTKEPITSLHYPEERTRTWSRGGLRGEDRYDGFGRLRNRTRHDGIEETYEFDRLGRHVCTRERVNGATRLIFDVTYDALGRLTREHPILEGPRSYQYSAQGGRQETVVHTDGGSCSWSVDPWRQVVASCNLSGQTEATYNTFGQPTLLVHRDTCGKTQSRHFQYDGLGNLVGTSMPETGSTSFKDLDVWGQARTTTDASKRTIIRSFDALGRTLVEKGNGLTWTTIYNGPFPVARHSSDGVAQTFTYRGPGGRMDTETLSIKGRTHAVRYGYEPTGNLASISYPSGRNVGYAYDSLQRLNQVTLDGRPLATASYDGWGNLEKLLFSSGASSSWSWGEKGHRLESACVAHAHGREDRTFDYDASGLLAQSGEWALRHDGLGRLVRAEGFGMVSTHGHDGFGNATSHSLAGDPPATFVPFNLGTLEDNRVPGLQPTGGLTGWVVEANGEATRIGDGVGSIHGLELNWDGLGRVAEVANRHTGVVQRFQYAPSGMRVAVHDLGNPRESRHFVYTDRGCLLSEFIPDGRWERDVVYFRGQAIAEVKGAGIHELHPDHLGTPRVVTNGTTGQVEGRQAFGPYGEQIPWAPHTSGYAPLAGYTGHMRTEPSGLIYMKARFYSPGWHRFLNSDWGADPRSRNQFAYAGGNPFQATDPTGLMLRNPQGGLPFAGEATVVVEDTMPPPIPQIPVPPRPPMGPPPPLPSPFFPTPLIPPFSGPNHGGHPGPGYTIPSGQPTFVPQPLPPSQPIDPARMERKGPAPNPATASGQVAAALEKGDLRGAFQGLKAKAISDGLNNMALRNQQTIRDLQAANDTGKYAADCAAINAYLKSIGKAVAFGAGTGAVTGGEIGATLGGIFGVGVGAVPLGGTGALGGAILGGFSGLVPTSVAGGIALREQFQKIEDNWKANYRAIQNYSDINCIGSKPEVRY